MKRHWLALLSAPFLMVMGASGQATIDVNIGGKTMHLTQRPEIVAVRVVKSSEAISGDPAFSNAFAVVEARSGAAGLLGIARAPAATGAMPSGTAVYKSTNQVQQVPVYATGSSAVDVALFPELIVQFKEGVTDAVARQRLRIYGAQTAYLTPVPGRYLVAMPQPQSVISATNNMPKNVPEVLYAEPNFYYIHRSSVRPPTPLPASIASPHPSASIGDPRFSDQWTLATTPIDFGVVHAWDGFNTKGENVKVAIVDDGVDLNHEDLKDAISDFWDTTAGTPASVSKQGPYSLQPEADHGTKCAGIVAARLNNIGIVGVAPNVKLIAIKAATYVTVNNQPQWVNSTAALADGIDKASALGADVISASWGMPSGSTSIDITNAIDRALNGTNGRRILVFAAGNLEQSDSNQSLTMDFPASLADRRLGLIAVAASTPCDEVKSFQSCDNETWWASKYLPKPTILAPGTAMMTTAPGNQYSLFSGTSAATPFVAGVIALMMSKEPALTRAQIVQRLNGFSRTLTAGSDTFIRVDAYCLLSGTGQCGH